MLVSGVFLVAKDPHSCEEAGLGASVPLAVPWSWSIGVLKWSKSVEKNTRFGEDGCLKPTLTEKLKFEIPVIRMMGPRKFVSQLR